MRWIWVCLFLSVSVSSWAQSSCGDGKVEGTEQCDDGSANSEYGPCLKDCTSKFKCGNRLPDEGEQCDDGNQNSGDGCRGDCKKIEICGDKIIDRGEQCDDGNTIAGDGCRADCKGTERCGDGQLDELLGEVCDDGNTQSFDLCSKDCHKKTAPSVNPSIPEPSPEPEVPIGIEPKSPGVAFFWSIGCAFFCPVVGASAGYVYTRDWLAVGVSVPIRVISLMGFFVARGNGNLIGMESWAGMYVSNEIIDLVFVTSSAKKYNKKWFGDPRPPGIGWMVAPMIEPHSIGVTLRVISF